MYVGHLPHCHVQGMESGRQREPLQQDPGPAICYLVGLAIQQSIHTCGLGLFYMPPFTFRDTVFYEVTTQLLRT